MKFFVGIFIGLLALISNAYAVDTAFVEHMQEVSFTVKSDTSEGSATLVTREVSLEDGKKVKVNFLLTAGHVVDGLRTVREIIDANGVTKKVVEFKDAGIIKEFRLEGRRVGETKLDVKIVKFSDATNGEDIAILMVRMHNWSDKSAEFYLKQEIPSVGSQLYHCGSLLGQMGANSLTSGMMSQIGRVHDGKVYDQSTVTAFPGSSGGGVWITQDKGNPLYVGMVTRGTGETFNLLVPIRRLLVWAKANKMEWFFNTTIPIPTMKEIGELPIEAATIKIDKPISDNKKDFIFLDGAHKDEWYGQRNSKKQEVLPRN